MRHGHSTWEEIPTDPDIDLPCPSPEYFSPPSSRSPSPLVQPFAAIRIESFPSPDLSPPLFSSFSSFEIVPPTGAGPLPTTLFSGSSPSSVLPTLPPTRDDSPSLPFLPPAVSAPEISFLSLDSPPSSYHTAYSTTPPLSLLPAETEFLQLHSENAFTIQDLFVNFPLAVRIWAGESRLGGMVARLDLQSSEVAMRVLEKNGVRGEKEGLGEYSLWAEVEDEEWWEDERTVFWRGVRWFCESGEGG